MTLVTPRATSDLPSLLNAREKRLDCRYAYKLQEGQYALDTVVSAEPEVDESQMAFTLPFADGNRRDGVGDLLEVGGIRTERHRANPIIGFDHFKKNEWPIGLAEDRKTKQYTVEIDPVRRTAKCKVFVYQSGKGNEHLLFCEQVFDLWCKRLIRGGSIGYQVVKALELRPDYDTGAPQGLHLLVVNMLEASAVVLPANQDTVVKVLAMPRVCGKPLCGQLVKSLSAYAPERTTTSVGFCDVKELSPLSTTNVPPAKWKPGVGAIKELRKKYRRKSADLKRWEVYVNGKYHSVEYARTKEEAEQVVKAKLSDPSAKVEAKGPLTPGASGMGKALKTPRSRGGESKPLHHEISVGDLVTVRNAIGLQRRTLDAPYGSLFAQAGDKLTVIALRPGAAESVVVRNDKGQEQAVVLSSLRKSLSGETKSIDLSDIRKKYRRAKGLRRRLKKSSPGSSVLHVRAKDVDAAREMAEGKGIQFARVGTKDGHERVKLIGDDGAIDEVAKAFGQLVGVKGMSESKGMGELSPSMFKGRLREGMFYVIVNGKPVGGPYADPRDAYDIRKRYGASATIAQYEGGQFEETTRSGDRKTLPSAGNKAMAEDIDTTSHEPVEGEKSAEPWGSQVLRRMHEDAGILMKDYHEMLGPLEHEQVKGHLEDFLGHLDKHMTKTEQLHAKHYKDLDPIEGAGDDAPEGEEKDMEEAVPDDSGSEELEEPTPDEAVEGMTEGEEAEHETKDLDPEEQKALRLKYRKKSCCKSVCPDCGKENCSCKSLKGKKALTEDEADKVEGEIEGVAEDLADATEDTEKEKSLEPHEQEKVGEAHEFLKELSDPSSQFDDEARMKSYHFHKALDPIASAGQETPAEEDMLGEKALEEEKEDKDIPGDLNPVEEAAGEPTGKDMVPDAILDGKSMSCRKAIGNASALFKELSQTQPEQFSDEHRQKALGCHKDLAPHVGGADEQAPVEVGEMGEKSLKEIFLVQRKAMQEMQERLKVFAG